MGSLGDKSHLTGRDLLNALLEEATSGAPLDVGESINERVDHMLLRHFLVLLSTEFPEEFVVGGANALMARFGDFRTTRDIDLDTDSDFDEQYFNDKLAQISKLSQVKYVLAGRIKRHKGNSGIAMSIQASSKNTQLGTFKLDLSPGRSAKETGRGTIASPINGFQSDTAITSIHQHTANKICAIQPRLIERDGSIIQMNTHRYHDLVDLALIAKHSRVDLDKVVDCIKLQIATKHQNTQLLHRLEVPGDDWNNENWEAARRRKHWPKSITLEVALATAAPLVDKVLSTFHNGKIDTNLEWLPTEGIWALRRATKP